MSRFDDIERSREEADSVHPDMSGDVIELYPSEPWPATPFPVSRAEAEYLEGRAWVRAYDERARRLWEANEVALDAIVGLFLPRSES